jgi:hypothetical protein
MVNVIVLFPGKSSEPGLVLQEGTRVGVREGVGEIVGVWVIVGEAVALGEAVNVAEGLGVLVKPGRVAVLVAVLVAVGVAVGVPVFVGVDVSGCQLEGGAVTNIVTLTITVRALWALIALLLASERSRKPTIFGTIGK